MVVYAVQGQSSRCFAETAIQSMLHRGYSSYLKSLVNQKSIKIVYREQFSGYSGKPVTNIIQMAHVIIIV